MFAFMLHSEYTTSCFMAKSVVWHNFQSSSIRHCFALNSTFIQPSVCKYVLFFSFFFLSVRLQVSFIPMCFRYFGQRFFFCIVNLSRESRVMPPPPWFSWRRIEIIFHGRCRPRKLKSAKNDRHVFETKPRKFGDAKISHYMVSRKTLRRNQCR